MSIVDIVARDMRDSQCNPILIADIEQALEHVSNSRQYTFMMLEQGYSQADIGHVLGKTDRTVRRYVHTLRSTMYSLLDSSYT
jgi:DNA-directed RNA polymerase specialized sigma24 family protein